MCESGTDLYSCMILLSSSQQRCQERADSLSHPRLELCQSCIEGNRGMEIEVVGKKVIERDSIRR